MIEKDSGNNGYSPIPSAFVDAFPDGFPTGDDPILTRVEIDKLTDEINREFIASMLSREEYIYNLNA